MVIRTIIKRISHTLKIPNAEQRLKEATFKAFSPKYLLYTNIGISLTLSCVGDCIEQNYEIYSKKLSQWNRKRTERMALSGITVGVVCHYWYQILDKILKGRTIKTVVQKVLLDQFICSPIYISVFFITVAILEDKTLEETLIEIDEKAWQLYRAEWVVWPTAQAINFLFIPSKYRVLYDNTVSLGMDVFTSKIKYS